jgi:hypothetical protein
LRVGGGARWALKPLELGQRTTDSFRNLVVSHSQGLSAGTLPANYVAHNWPATWIGFDCVLIAFMIATAVLGSLRRELVILPGFTTGVLLICDARFDIMTAGPGQLWMPVVTAALLNVPIAAIMLTGAVRIVRLTATRLWFLDPATPAWRLPLVP